MTRPKVGGLLVLASLALVLTVQAVLAPTSSAQDPRRLAAARELFLQRLQTTPPDQLVPIDDFSAQVFRNAVLRQGLRPIRIRPETTVTAQQLFFRQSYISNFYARRSQFLGGQAGGIAYTPTGSPIEPVSTFNIFNFFPAFRLGGIRPGQ